MVAPGRENVEAETQQGSLTLISGRQGFAAARERFKRFFVKRQKS